MLKKLSLMNKGIVIGTAVLVFIIVATIVALMLSGNAEAYRLLKVFELDGKASVERVNIGKLDAYAGMNLESGDVLTVDDGGYMGLSLDDDKYVYIDEGTVIELVATGTPSDSRTTINLREGYIISEINKPLSAGSSYNVNTPTATMAVRGTIMYNYYRIIKDADGKELRLSIMGTFKGSGELIIDGASTTTTTQQQYTATITVDGKTRTVNLKDVDIFSFESVMNAPDANGPLPADELPQTVLDNSLQISESTKNKSIKPYIPTRTDDVREYTATTTVSTQAGEITATSSDTPPVYDIPVGGNTPVSGTTVPPREDLPVESPSSDNVPVTTAENTDTPTDSGITSTSNSEEETTAKTTVATTVNTTAETTEEKSQTTTDTTTTAKSPVYSGGIVNPPDTKSYTVTFVADGTTIVTKTLADGVAYGSSLPAIPEKTGYTGKWMCDGAEFTSTTVISANSTVTVEYTKNKYTISYISSYDNSTLKTDVCEYGDTLPQYTAAETINSGAVELYYYGIVSEPTAGYLVDDDVDIIVGYAEGSDLSVLFTYAASDNSYVLKLCKNGEAVALPENPSADATPAGMSFGWFDANSGFSSTFSDAKEVTDGHFICGDIYTNNVFSAGDSYKVTANTRLAGFNYQPIEYIAEDSSYTHSDKNVQREVVRTGYALLGKSLSSAASYFSISSYCKLFPDAPKSTGSLTFDGWKYYRKSDDTLIENPNNVTITDGTEYYAVADITDNRNVVSFYKDSACTELSSVQYAEDGETVTAPEFSESGIPYSYVDANGKTMVFMQWETDDGTLVGSAALSDVTADRSVYPVYCDADNAKEFVLFTEGGDVFEYRLYCYDDYVYLPTADDMSEFRDETLVANGVSYSWFSFDGLVFEDHAAGFGLASNIEATPIYPVGHKTLNRVITDQSVHITNHCAYLYAPYITVDTYSASGYSSEFFLTSDISSIKTKLSGLESNHKLYMSKCLADDENISNSSAIVYEEIADIDNLSLTGNIVAIPTDKTKHLVVVADTNGTVTNYGDVADSGEFVFSYIEGSLYFDVSDPNTSLNDNENLSITTLSYEGNPVSTSVTFSKITRDYLIVQYTDVT